PVLRKLIQVTGNKSVCVCVKLHKSVIKCVCVCQNQLVFISANWCVHYFRPVFYILHFTFTFTFSHLADAFVQSDVQCFTQFNASLSPMLHSVQCFTQFNASLSSMLQECIYIYTYI